MSEESKTYVNCARCGRNIGVTWAYVTRKAEAKEPIYCKDCRIDPHRHD